MILEISLYGDRKTLEKVGDMIDAALSIVAMMECDEHHDALSFPSAVLRIARRAVDQADVAGDDE